MEEEWSRSYRSVKQRGPLCGKAVDQHQLKTRPFIYVYSLLFYCCSTCSSHLISSRLLSGNKFYLHRDRDRDRDREP